MSVSLNTLDQKNRSNGNETQLEQNDITGNLSYRFRMPRSLSGSRKEVRSTLSYIRTGARSCLVQGSEAGTPCTSVSDVQQRELRGALDTDLLQTLSGGLTVGYTINDARHLNQRTSQISVIASFQLSLFSGDYR